MTPTLYHFSEEAGIEVFVPRLVAGRPDVTVPAVWAIEDTHQHMYLFPRDCPRALLWPTDSTTDADRDHWLGHSDARVVAHVEYAWLDRIRRTTLYRYSLPADSFRSLEDAGMWVSMDCVTPSRVDEITDIPEALSGAGVELRVMARLTPLRGIWEQTTMHWSGIRLRNAQDWDIPSSPAPDLLMHCATD